MDGFGHNNMNIKEEVAGKKENREEGEKGRRGEGEKGTREEGKEGKFERKRVSGEGGKKVN
jgi:hypothetical protein